MNSARPLSKVWLALTALLTAFVAVFFALAALELSLHKASLAVFAHPLVAAEVGLLVAGLVAGFYECARGIRARPSFSPLITFVILIGAAVLAPLCIAKVLRALKRPAPTMLLKDARLGESAPESK